MLILILNEAVFSSAKGSNGQNHSSSGSYCLVKKFSLLAKYTIHLPPAGDTHLPHLSTIWKALIYKVVIVGSLLPAMGNRTSSSQSHFGNKQDGTLFS